MAPAIVLGGAAEDVAAAVDPQQHRARCRIVGVAEHSDSGAVAEVDDCRGGMGAAACDESAHERQGGGADGFPGQYQRVRT